MSRNTSARHQPKPAAGGLSNGLTTPCADVGTGLHGLATREASGVSAAGARTTQGVQIGLANFWQTTASGSRGGDRLGAGPGLSCWFGVEPPAGSNRRPHPCHGTTGNRCAERHSRRSCSTVGAEGIGSLPAKVGAHFPVTLFMGELVRASYPNELIGLCPYPFHDRPFPSARWRQSADEGQRPRRGQGPDPVVHVKAPAADSSAGRPAG
jgi:hypothetical protein